MSKKHFRSRFLPSALLAGVAAAALPSTAIAQEDVDRLDDQAGEAEEEVSRQDVVVVTGSLIPQTGNLVETSPVTAIDSADFEVRGVLRAEDMINTLPQAFGAQGSNVANGSTGTASVNLRGLGASRTLVLMNGRRLPYGSTNISSPDINFIPSALVEKVDILTGGASATYGSDAIAGVVNFVLDDDFTGLQVDVNYSMYQHDNDSSLQGLLAENAAVNPSQFRVPDGSVTDGESVDVTAIFGGGFDNGKGHFTGFAGYQNTNEVLQGDRDYSQCALGTDEGAFTCSGSSTNQYTNLLDLGSRLPDGTWARVNPNADEFIARDFTTDTFNFNPFNHYQRPNERYNFGMFADYQVADNIEAYGEFMFMDNQTDAQIAPSGVFGYGIAGGNGGINCDNVFFSDQQRDYLCGPGGLTPNANGNVGVGEPAGFDNDFTETPALLFLRRNVEGAPRSNFVRHTTYRGVVGIRGDLEGLNIGYDLSAQYSRVLREERYRNDLSVSRISKALDAVADPATGEPVCAVNVDDDPSNDDAACVPYNIWGGTGPSDAAIDYVTVPLLNDGQVEQAVVTGKLFGDLGDAGIQSPMADESPAWAFGFEYRGDDLQRNPDAAFQAGDGAGQGGPTLPVSGSQDVVDVFGELNVPLIQGRPGIETLGFDLAYRKSFYEDIDSDAYKAGLDYAPTSDIRFRASYQRAVRAPNIFELFVTPQIGLFDLTEGPNGLYDPCAGDFDPATADPEPSATFEQCASTGVTMEQYGQIADNPAGQFNERFGGNRNLEPEKADTYTVGFVLTPRFLEGLTLSVDYFDIQAEQYINAIAPTISLNQCLNSGDDFFCDFVNRGQGGTLWASQTGYIEALDRNTGQIGTTGFDILANYVYDAGELGMFDFDYVGTLLDSLEVEPLEDTSVVAPFDCAGTYGGRCQDNFGNGANPEYRHKASVTWALAKWSVTGTWRYFDEVTLDESDGTGPNGTLDAQNYLDLSARYDVLDNVTLRAGVNNVTDEDPPVSSVVGTAPGNGNTYPQVYDAFGRYIFAGATVDF